MKPRADVLIVARDRVQVETMQQLLRGMGVWGAASTTDAAEAHAWLHSARPETIIVGEGLNGQDSLEFIRAVRMDPAVLSRRCHILYVGKASPTLASSAAAVGAHSVATLPMSLSDLMKVMAEMKSDDRPFVEFSDYAGPCRRVKRTAGRDVPRRRDSDQAGLTAALRSLFLDLLRKLSALPATAESTEQVFVTVMELERTARELQDAALVQVTSALGEALSRRSTLTPRLAMLVREYASAVTHLAMLPDDRASERLLLAKHIAALAAGIRARGPQSSAA